MKSNFGKSCRFIFASTVIVVLFQNCQPASNSEEGATNQSSLGGNALDCAAPWDPNELIPNGTGIEAFSSSNVVEGMQCISEQRVCNDGILSGSYSNETCQVLPLATKECKVHLKSGASAATQVGDVDACLAYFAEIKKNNPKAVFSQVDFDGKPILVIETNPPPKTKATYKGYFVTNGMAQLFIETRNISEAAALANCKENAAANPKNGIKCVWGSKVILNKAEPVAKKTCKVSFKDGASIATKVKTKTLCESYYKEIKKNNPKNPILKLEFDGKKIL